MTPHQKKNLEKLVKALDEVKTLIGEILHESAGNSEPEPPSDFDAASALTSLRTVDRSTAEKRLGVLKQHELGAIFVEAGGPSADKKKPKAWLIEQILWRVYDFERGHEAIRGHRAKGN